MLKTIVVARVIFKRRNPGAAEDGSVKVLVVARAIFSGTQAPVGYAAARGDPDASPTPDKAQA